MRCCAVKTLPSRTIRNGYNYVVLHFVNKFLKLHRQLLNWKSLPRVKASHVPLPVRSFKSTLAVGLPTHCFSPPVCGVRSSAHRLLSPARLLCSGTDTLALRSDQLTMTTNPPLPQYDMMTGQLVTDASPVFTNAAAMMANHADVVHVQLLDRMIVVPTAVVNVSL